ncbi:hypothetical protein QBC34DRAFT_72580 [Podospora aff. communis PSN243]|uniref:HECT-type E3 ubiquitin transferase n=1 Tax=Podospora aff. communis PSN243 TaxID=3040156 RepID=A0AAV9H3L5_9PEZI|nr:hypothetical protein QBC34DRAFT_72580 [Podospora aff. communis PSN243]
MGKITKTMQPKHKETLSPWLKDYVQAAASVPLPLIPKKLEEFPSRWPFPRGDLYHWIPLLNRFDSILESFCETYNLHEGFQMRDFGCDVLLNSGAPVDYRDDTPWDKARLSQLGYSDGGDCQLIVAVLKFTRMLLERCGNRSIYASSSHLNSLLNSTDLEVVLSTLRVGLELAQRYQASVKRISAPSRHQVNTALLANHYNIDLDRVQCVAQPFAKTPIIRLSDPAPTTPASAGKGKEKERGHGAAQKNVASMYANDLMAVAAPDKADEGRWNGWGDVKLPYYPKPETAEVSATETTLADGGGSSAPTTPTPLRRSSTGVTQTPRSHRISSSDDSPTQRTPGNNVDAAAVSGPKYVEIRQSTVQSTPIYDLLKQCPPGMSDTSRYEFLNRLRICKALLGSAEDRQLALAVRLLAVTNLAYIHPEAAFIEKALKQDNDEPRRFQLVYQLAELIHPSADGAKEVPRWLQAIAMALLEAILNYPSKYGDVLSALNANVNHGVLLYVIRKAVAEMKADPEDDVEGQVREDDRWRDSLFSLTLHLAMGSRIGQDMAGAGLMEILVEMLNLRSRVASRSYSTVLSFLDSLIYAHQGTFAMFTSASGLDAIANLIIHTVNTSKSLTAAGQGTKPAFHASLVDYDIPYYEQQTLKWLLKFIHHLMTNSFSGWGNTDRHLRNLVDNSALLGSLRAIIQDMRLFGSVVWTNAATLLSDFINNDPTSFAAISESGMIQTFLEALTGRPVVMDQPPATPRPDAHDDEDPASPSYSEQSVTFERDDRPHPPTQETLEAPRDSPLAHGILPSNDAILVIPGVLNSISLNNSGMKMVVSSRAFESYLEIFESPDHVHCLQMETELPTNIGTSLEELARHHPALRPALSNAVIDMVARVVHLAKTKAQTAGWGAKLEVVDVDGNSVTADGALLEKSSGATTSSKGKQKAVGDTDVDMTDVSAPSVPSISSVDTTIPRIGPQSAGVTAPYKEITPYILVLSQFLIQAMGTSNMKPAFVQAGGIELLLDLMEAPSLQDDFGDTNASRALSQVVAQLIESNQIVGHPSLLNRILDALSTLQPLIKREESYPFFGPFLIPDLSLRDSKGGWDQTMVRKVADGTAVVKTLVNFQNLIRTLYQSFPYSSRSQIHSLPQVNIYDYYTRLIKDLGPLLRQVLFEEMSIKTLVPQHWTGAKLSLERDGELVTAPIDDTAVASILSTSWTAGIQDASASSKSLSVEEQSTVQYRNFLTISGLLHSILPSTLPFFQTTGKSLLQRRVTDPYLRYKHLCLAEALAETILDQLKPPGRESTINDFQYWIIMFHTVHEMLVDSQRHTDRHTVQLIAPVLVAFKEYGGFEVLNDLLQSFAKGIASSSEEDHHKSKLAAAAMKKILEIYALIVNGKNVAESLNQSQLPSSGWGRGKDYASQLVVELKMSILPVVRSLWENESLIEKSTPEILKKIVEILKTISTVDTTENGAFRKSDNRSPIPTFKGRPSATFGWDSYQEHIHTLSLLYPDKDLVREAVYRSLGRPEDSTEYCKVHKKGVAGKRNPIPEAEAYREPQAAVPGGSGEQSAAPPASSDLAADPMSLDPSPGTDNHVPDNLDDEDSSSESSDDDDLATSSQRSASQEASAAAKPASSSNQAAGAEAPATITKDDLDAERATIQEGLIDRCLDVIRAHPDSVFDISDLIRDTLFKPDSEDKRTEVGETLADALTSFRVEDKDERKANGQSIAAYAHLLCLLLKQNQLFFKSTLPALKRNISEYLVFLDLPPAGSKEELPPWMPYLLLMFELLLADDAQPPEFTWRAPTKDEEPVQTPELVLKEPSLTPEQRLGLLTMILEVLPRIGKEQALAVSVLRILVILTRDYSVAKIVGEKRNLQRLFVMAKQLCSGGSTPLKKSHISDNIMIILRHIVEDEQTIRQIMEAEIRQYMYNHTRGSTRPTPDIQSYLRHLSHVALRSPNVFIDVTLDIIKLPRWQPQPAESAPRPYAIALKETLSDAAVPAKDTSIEPAVQATEDLTISDVKPTTETDKEMIDVTKTPAQELKRPVLENPDGVVPFLLGELSNYRLVGDPESSTSAAEDGSPTSEPAPNGGAGSSAGEEQVVDTKDKDKKNPKPVFKAEDHPIFVYRCFLLNCLAELLQSFTRAKVEFINFKRNTPIQTGTPIKPRSHVLNYLLNDLLCSSHTINNMDSLAVKKKTATSNQVQAVLVALVSRTGEKAFDRHRGAWEYDEDSDLLFVRRFVLDTVLRAYKEASVPSEPFDVRYGRMICLAELMSQMMGDKDRDAVPSNSRGADPAVVNSHSQIRRLMYEKGYLAALTASIADIDLTFPNVKRTIKYILRVLKSLTKTAYQLSQSNVMPVTSTDQVDDDFASASSLSDMDSDREETPDLYRNSALGMLEPGREDDFSEDSDEDDDDMYDDDHYDEEVDYEDDMSQDGEDNPSDDDEELGEMGPIEGLSGEPGVVEVIMGENEDDDEDMDEDDDDRSSDVDEDELHSHDMQDVEDRIQVMDDEGNPMEDDGASAWESGTDEEDEEDEDEIDFEAEAQDHLHEAHMHEFHEARTLSPFADNLRAVMEADALDAGDMQAFEDGYLEDGADEDDEEDEEEVDDEGLYYDQDHINDDLMPSNMPLGLGWDIAIEPQPRFRPGGARGGFPTTQFMIGGPRDGLGGMLTQLLLRIAMLEREEGLAVHGSRTDPYAADFRNFISRSHNIPRSVPNAIDDGVNPLLLPSNRAGRDPSPRDIPSNLIQFGLPAGLLANFENPLAFIHDLVNSFPAMAGRHHHGDRFQFRLNTGSLRQFSIPLNATHAIRESRPDPDRAVYQEPAQAVSFTPELTVDRWQEEAKMVFGSTHMEKVNRLYNKILGSLVPAAKQAEKEQKAREEEERQKKDEERKRREELERKLREAKEAEEKAAREKQEAEERERAERERTEAAAQAAEEMESHAEAGQAVDGPQAMEGVEAHAASQSEQQPEAPRERITTVIRGDTMDITDLGIDPEYLAALPEEFREEVILQTVSARRLEAREQAAVEGENTEAFQEFLEALPEELRQEIVAQERAEQRRRNRQDPRGQAGASGQDAGPADMDPASILLTFPPELRTQVLIDQGDDLIDHLPPDLAAEARALQRHNQSRRAPQANPRAHENRQPEASGAIDPKAQRRSIVQMLDKAGVATLLRLMFVIQQGSIRNYLFEVFSHVCENRQNRLEVISTLLQILQDGSTDMDAVERSFSQLSLKAKQPKDKDPKTPTSLKRTYTNISTNNHILTNSDVSPLLVVQQCLDLLVELATRNMHVPSLFLTEHETVASTLKRSLSRKGKGKDVNTKAQKYAINSLLSLLDRSLIMESSAVMQYLADLLNKVTYPLQAIERRRKEAEEEAKKEVQKAKAAETAATQTEGQPTGEQVPEAPATTSADEPAAEATEQPAAESSAAKETKPDEKKTKMLTPPVISEHNLKLVINIFVARECSSKTFQNTISTIKNLSNIPGAKKIFGEELVRQARALSENILLDLDDLLPHILKAESGTEIQGVALAKFSPGASEQNKLLRVLTALDHLFDSRSKKSESSESGVKENTKEDLLGSLYWNPTFGTMWDKLSACLSAIRQRENMLNVATILLPLIESLMVVCKNTALADTATSQAVPKEMLLSSPPPENRIAGLFFTFTEEHRRILNELVRHNPKLMSGTFSLLVKNPKVLEFDNKRNYFNRSVHSKAGSQQTRTSYAPLQLQVRREHVFHDSFKALYFKSGAEMKFGKLNIRFHGEEGVDAGGVTREWFQVLARQMFDPNYALFIPVSSDRTTFHPNKLSAINDEHLSFFKFIGRVIGKALYEGRLLDCYFSRAVYKRILGKAVSVKDMESFDPDYYKSLVWMLENDITDIITETFSVEDDEFGVTKVVDLCDNGRNIVVTEENKHEYVRMIVEHKLLSSVKDQMEHFLKGFHEIIPEELIAIFNEQELELLISGLPDIDVDDWKSNTEYQNYTAASQQIQWFWRAVRSFDKEERAKLLQFVTGTSKVPLNGFKELEGMNGISRFNIHRDYGNKERLPSSHTCFNQLDLPEYESYDILRAQVLKAITQGSEYFGFA